MKKVFFKSLMAAFVVASFVQCTGKTQNTAAPAFSNDSNSLSVVYIRQDSLLSQYNLYKEISEENLKKEENIRATINSKQRSVDKEAMEFQHKYENNAFATRERAEQEYNRIMQKQQELQTLTDKLTLEFATEKNKSFNTVIDSVQSVLNDVRKEFGYSMIISDPLCADESLDITSLVVERLNSRYKPAAK